MTERPNNHKLVGKFPRAQIPQPLGIPMPFWFSSSNYYVLAIAVSIASFFLIWGFFSGSGEGVSWVSAGVAASLVLIGSVVLRAILFRRMQQRLLAERKRVESNLRNFNLTQLNQNPHKLTIEKNSLILGEIERKSKAARVLEKLPEGHLEVFEMCEEYLRKNKAELESVRVGSPRLPVLRKSREKIEKFHRYHLLTWASVESRLLIQTAKSHPEINEKLNHSQKALSVLDSAVRFYPNETLLIDSIKAVKEFIVTVKINHWTEQAERASSKGNYKRAINHYQDALFYLARENEQTPEKDAAAEKINLEIQKLNEIKNKE